MSAYNVSKHTPDEMERRQIGKVVRSAIRLHFAMLADEAINERLPDILDRQAESEGPFVLDLADLDLPALP